MGLGSPALLDVPSDLVGAVYLFVSLVLWIAKYVAYQTVIFRAPQDLDEQPADSSA